MRRSVLILLDKTAFRLVFWLVAAVASLKSRETLPPAIDISPTARILVIRPGGLGDAIMCIPLLRKLKADLPGARVTALCVAKNRAIFELSGLQDDLVVADSMKAMARLLKRQYDVVLDLEPYRRVSGIIAYMTRAPIRVGFDTGPRRLLYTHLVSYAHDSRFETQNMGRQLEVIKLRLQPAEAADLRFELPQKMSEDPLLPDATVSTSGVVAIAPGVLKPHHRWEPENWAKLIDLIMQRHEESSIVLLGSPADRADADRVLESTATRRIHDLVGKTKLVDTLRILQRCSVLVASDGGIVYMAAAMRCPTISLWGPGVMERFKPPGEEHIGVRKPYTCIPCVTWDRLGEFPACPYERRCYGDLTPEEVYRAGKPLWAAAG